MPQIQTAPTCEGVYGAEGRVGGGELATLGQDARGHKTWHPHHWVARHLVHPTLLGKKTTQVILVNLTES